MESKKGALANCVRVEETIPAPLEWADVAHLYQRISAIVEVEITPVLRHLDDMTQDDADSLARAIGLSDGWFTTKSLGAIVVGNVTVRERLFGDPRAWVWALNEGFDMFKLIERELAIRKEASNG